MPPKPVEKLPIRVGLIGAGFIGRLRARAIARVAGLRLDAVADPRADLADGIARAHGARSVRDGGEMAADPALDAVIISTPPDTHEPLGTACLRAGKHVLCEKPLATTPAACEALVQAAAAAGVGLATGFNLRYTRAARLAKQMLDGGAIGELDHIRSFHGHPGGAEFTHPWILEREVSGGGTLMDNGIHLIDLTRWLLGGVEEVRGYATSHVWRRDGCEDNGFLLLRNGRGRIATLHASWTEWRGYGYRVEIYGTEGLVRFGYPPLRLVLGRRRAGGKLSVERHLFPGYQIAERIRGFEWGLVETLALELDGWAEALVRGVEPPTSGRDGAEAVRIAQSAQVL